DHLPVLDGVHGEDADPVLVAHARPVEGRAQALAPGQQLAVADAALPLHVGGMVRAPAGVAFQVVGEGQGQIGMHGVFRRWMAGVQWVGAVRARRSRWKSLSPKRLSNSCRAL